MSHTPGPWKWWTSNSVMRLSAERDGDVLHAFKAADGFPCIGVNMANARLIAAAPDLYESLHILVQALKIAWSEEDRRIPEYQAALAAIAKAEGKE